MNGLNRWINSLPKHVKCLHVAEHTAILTNGTLPKNENSCLEMPIFRVLLFYIYNALSYLVRWLRKNAINQSSYFCKTLLNYETCIQELHNKDMVKHAGYIRPNN